MASAIIVAYNLGRSPADEPPGVVVESDDEMC
jgi:hypothetical protein